MPVNVLRSKGDCKQKASNSALSRRIEELVVLSKQHLSFDAKVFPLTVDN